MITVPTRVLRECRHLPRANSLILLASAMIKNLLKNSGSKRGDPDNHQDLIICCLWQCAHFLTISSKSVHNLLSYFCKHTDTKQLHSLFGGHNNIIRSNCQWNVWALRALCCLQS